MRTPADVLAERLLALDARQKEELLQAWRRESANATMERSADALAAAWARPADMPSTGREPGWRAADEALLQHGLDRLLRLCHPDFGGGALSL